MSDSSDQPLRLQLADADALQHLLERCSDYYELHEGWATPADAGAYELTAVPDGRSAAELHVVGLQTSASVLDAVIVVMPDYPRAAVWWIGLLVVAPEARGRGFGRALLQHMLDIAAAAGAVEIQLGVLPKNPRGQKFWREAGFRETGQVREVKARNGHIDSINIMSLALP